MFLALPISPIGRIGLISPIFNALYGRVLFSIPVVMGGNLFLGCVPLVSRVSFSIPMVMGVGEDRGRAEIEDK